MSGFEIFCVIVAALTGLCMGSFANVVIYRVPKGLSIVKPGSFCPACNHALGAFDLFPVFSWLFLRGKCRYCGRKISPRYPGVELLTGALFALFAAFNPDAGYLAPFYCFLLFILVCAAFTDIDEMIIPDGLIIAGLIAAVPVVALGGDWLGSLLGGVLGFGVFFVIDKLVILVRKADGFGGGDMKLMGMAGLYLGLQGTAHALFAAVILGGAWAAYLLITKKIERGGYFAFGPFLVAAGAGALIFYGG